jgi:hypothetical protein
VRPKKGEPQTRQPELSCALRRQLSKTIAGKPINPLRCDEIASEAREANGTFQPSLRVRLNPGGLDRSAKIRMLGKPVELFHVLHLEI